MLYTVLQNAKITTLKSIGYTTTQINSIREYEFNVDGFTGKTKSMEIWTNSTRTKGHKVITTPVELEYIFKPFCP